MFLNSRIHNDERKCKQTYSAKCFANFIELIIHKKMQHHDCCYKTLAYGWSNMLLNHLKWTSEILEC